MAVNIKIGSVFDSVIKVLSFICLSAYSISTLRLSFFPDKYLLPFVFLLGTMGIIALANLYFKYSFKAKDLPYYKVGSLLLAAAFLQLTTMLVVQQSTAFAFSRSASPESGTGLIFTLINSIQLGIDVVFDILYSFGIILISLSLIIANSKSLAGWYGILIALSLLIINLYSFPLPPKENGLIDIGIFSILWWILLIIEIKKTNYGKNFR